MTVFLAQMAIRSTSKANILNIACSYDRISFDAASGPELDNITSADGVIDVIIDYDDSDTAYKIENYVKAIVTIPVSDGGYGLDLDYYDHVIFHMPKGVKKGHGSGTDWIAHAQKVRALLILVDTCVYAYSSFPQLLTLTENIFIL